MESTEHTDETIELYNTFFSKYDARFRTNGNATNVSRLANETVNAWPNDSRFTIHARSDAEPSVWLKNDWTYDK